MPGIAGGNDGAANRLLTNIGGEPHEVGILSERVPHEPGECYEYYYGGGGGWGNPLDRPPEKVLDDVLDEYVSVAAAEQDYGVVLRGSLEKLTLKIDRKATEKTRKRMRNSNDRRKQ